MASINKADILKSVDYAKKNQLFNKLNNIYDNLPKGECTGCGSCCMESVGLNLIEFLNIFIKSFYIIIYFLLYYNDLNKTRYIYKIQNKNKSNKL